MERLGHGRGAKALATFATSLTLGEVVALLYLTLQACLRAHGWAGVWRGCALSSRTPTGLSQGMSPARSDGCILWHQRSVLCRTKPGTKVTNGARGCCIPKSHCLSQPGRGWRGLAATSPLQFQLQGCGAAPGFELRQLWQGEPGLSAAPGDPAGIAPVPSSLQGCSEGM